LLLLLLLWLLLLLSHGGVPVQGLSAMLGGHCTSSALLLLQGIDIHVDFAGHLGTPIEFHG